MATSDQTADSVGARWRTLSELSKAVAGYRSLEELFHDLSGRLHELLNFTYLSVVLHDAATGRMRVWQIEGASMPALGHGQGIPVELSPSGRVWTTQQPVVIHDTARAGPFPGVQKALHDANVRAFLSLPLTTVHRRLGAFNLGNAHPGVYDGVDLELPLLVASHIAVAVDNALHAEDAFTLQSTLTERNRDLVPAHPPQRSGRGPAGSGRAGADGGAQARRGLDSPRRP